MFGNRETARRSVVILGFIVASVAIVGAPATAEAQAPTVATVPWVPAAPRIPHDIIGGRATRLKGAEIHQNNAYRGTSY